MFKSPAVDSTYFLTEALVVGMPSKFDLVVAKPFELSEPIVKPDEPSPVI